MKHNIFNTKDIEMPPIVRNKIDLAYSQIQSKEETHMKTFTKTIGLKADTTMIDVNENSTCETIGLFVRELTD